MSERLVAISPALVPFAACRFQVEHQILHVQAELAERVLNRQQNGSSSLGILDDTVENRLDVATALDGQRRDRFDQLGDFFGKPVVLIRKAGKIRHFVYSLEV